MNAVLGPPPRAAGRHPAKLRHDEVVRSVAGSIMLKRADASILDVSGNLHVVKKLHLPNEVLVSGKAKIGERARLRALKAGGDVFLDRHVVVDRWIDAGGRLLALQHCSLGERATALEDIVVDRHVRFRLLAAPVIYIGRQDPVVAAERSITGARPAMEFADGNRSRPRGDGALLVDGDFALPSSAVVTGDIVARGSIRIGRDAIVDGSLHADVDVLLERDSFVSGSVFAERSLTIEPGATIREHALTRGLGRAGENVRIGQAGRSTTLLARGNLELAPGVVVYGRIVASARGVTI